MSYMRHGFIFQACGMSFFGRWDEGEGSIVPLRSERMSEEDYYNLDWDEIEVAFHYHKVYSLEGQYHPDHKEFVVTFARFILHDRGIHDYEVVVR